MKLKAHERLCASDEVDLTFEWHDAEMRHDNDCWQTINIIQYLYYIDFVATFVWFCNFFRHTHLVASKHFVYRKVLFCMITSAELHTFRPDGKSISLAVRLHSSYSAPPSAPAHLALFLARNELDKTQFEKMLRNANLP